MIHRILLTTLAVCGVTVGAFGRTFSETVDSIVSGNPELKAMMAEADASESDLKAENILADPEIEGSRLWRAGEGDNRWGVEVSQGFDWFGTYEARKDLVAKTKESNFLKLTAKERELKTAVGKALVELICADKEIALLSEIGERTDQLAAHYEKAWKAGETTILDLNKIKIEQARQKAQTRDAQSRRDAVMESIRTLSGNASMSMPADLDFPMMPLAALETYRGAVGGNSDLLALEGEVAAAESEGRLAKMSKYPGFSVGYSHDFEDGSHFNGLTLGMSLPVWSRRHKTAAASAKKLAAEYNVEQRRAELEASIDRLWHEAQSAEEMMGELGPLVEGVNNLELLKKALDGGEMNLLNYLQEVNYFLQARIDFLQLEKSYRLSVMELDAIAGVSR